MRTPDFEHNLLPVLQGRKPERATLFELFMDDRIYETLSGQSLAGLSQLSRARIISGVMARLGYDYTTVYASAFRFPIAPLRMAQSRSLNTTPMIHDWESFEKYRWPDPEDFDCSALEKMKDFLPDGMKLMVMGPGGIQENLNDIVGYENLCYLLYDEPELVQEIARQIGIRLVKYYELIASVDTVGFLCSNDDWGFNTQTFLSPEDMRQYIFPWHKRVVEVAHRHGKPCILHSCGEFRAVLDDIVEDMKFDARHSYEDNIFPVEEAYEQLNGRITVLGGIDMNLMISGSPEEIYRRASAMLERTEARGGYALGSGNSISAAVPIENLMALVKAATDRD